MDIEVVDETIEEQATPQKLGWCSGWEGIVFELEDEREEPEASSRP
jgi:hypothetical protein